MKISELEEKKYIVNILEQIMLSNIAIMELYKKTATNEESIKICEKSIKQSKQGIKMVRTINHIEILRSLFNRIVSGKEQYFVMVGSICSFKDIKKWDTTKKGFKEFISMEEQAQKEMQEELKNRREQQEFVQKAQEQGKNVEMVFDPQTKKMKPVIVEEKTNA